MGFNRRKMEDRRRKAAEKDAVPRAASEKQILEDAVFADHRRRHHGQQFVPAGALSNLPQGISTAPRDAAIMTHAHMAKRKSPAHVNRRAKRSERRKLTFSSPRFE
jgi:hypothetical protein